MKDAMIEDSKKCQADVFAEFIFFKAEFHFTIDLAKKELVFMASNSVTLLPAILKTKMLLRAKRGNLFPALLPNDLGILGFRSMSLRAKRGNPIKKNIFLLRRLLHSIRNDTRMRLLHSISKQLELGLGFLFVGALFEQADPSEASIVSGNNFDVSIPHPFHAQTDSLWGEPHQFIQVQFGQDVLLIFEFADKTEVDIPDAFAFGCFFKRLGNDLV